MASLIRGGWVVAAVTGAAALLAGCGGGSPAAGPTVTKTVTVKVTSSPAAATTPMSSPSTPAGPGPCQASALKVTLGRAGAAAGTAYYPIVFTNISGSACTLYGFPGVSFTGETYSVQVGPAASRNHNSPEHLVTLAPAGTASALIGVVDAENYGGGCGQTTVSGILVYPPNLTTSVGLPFNGMTCVNSRDPVLSVDAVVPGSTG
jgi:Protein of unknown function (DUF4232)